MRSVDIRLIEPQKEEEYRPIQISNYEKQDLLAKYGYTQILPAQQSQPEKKELSFEEMIRAQNPNTQNPNRPKPRSNASNNYSSAIKYDTDKDSGLNFKIEISTDMRLPE